MTEARDPLEIYSLSVAKAPLTCVRRAHRGSLGSNNSMGYCFEPGKTAVSLSGFSGLDSAYLKIGKFQGRFVSLETNIGVNGHELIRIHVDSLTGITLSEDGTFVPTLSVTPSSDLAIPVPGAVIAGNKLSGVIPSYPTSSKMNREAGLVILGAVINEQGNIEDLKVLETPSEQLGNAAAAAVRTWKYQPYLLNGIPVRVETTINVVYNLTNVVYILGR